MTLLQEIRAYLDQIQAESDGFSLSPSDKIVTAVSGGPDSLTLLHLLAQRGLHPPEKVIVAHLDHQLRPTSTEEAAEVCRIAAEWGVVCSTAQVDVQALAQQEGLSIEEAGRQARYRFFAEVAAEYDANIIFTGHHAGDQVETVLMHILRGSGSAGLRGILPVSRLVGHSGLWVVRPLLNTSREQIEAYCERHHLAPIIDESNKDTTYFRNRLRHDLLPYLEEYNPQIRERLWAMAAVTAADFEWLQQQTAEAWKTIQTESGQGWLRFELNGWRQLPLSLRRNTLRLAVAQLRPNLRDVGFQTIEQARQVAEKGVVGTEATLPGQVMLFVGYDDLTLYLDGFGLPLPELPQLETDEPLPLPVPGTISLASGWTLTGEIVTDIDRERIVQNENRWTAYLDIDRHDTLIVRPRLPGERFQPLGMNGRSKTVKDLMIDRKIPAQLRPRWPIIAASHLLWIVGHIQDERARVRPDSDQIVKLSLARSAHASGN